LFPHAESFNECWTVASVTCLTLTFTFWTLLCLIGVIRAVLDSFIDQQSTSIELELCMHQDRDDNKVFVGTLFVCVLSATVVFGVITLLMGAPFR